MIINTAGDYTLRYTATDECGNSSSVDRNLTVASPRTVLYTDGTFIINEAPADRARNEQAHGVATNEYIPFDPNSSNNRKKYIFSSASDAPWDRERSSILQVKVGAVISPKSLQSWFDGCGNMTSCDLSNLDTHLTTSFQYAFRACRAIESLDLSMLNAESATAMYGMFENCTALKTLDLSSFNTGHVTSMSNMFNFCQSLASLDLSSFSTSAVTSMRDMFGSCSALTSLDLSGFDTSAVTNMSGMFSSCSALATIFASQLFVTSQVTSSGYMFNSCSSLVGGAGTAWRSSYNDKTYARIDNPPDAPGYFTAKA